MDHFTIPCAIRIDTKGVLDIPANAEVVVNDNGEYAGYVTEDGDIFAHRGLPSALEAYILETEPAPEPAATPAAVEHAEATGVDLSEVEGTGKDGTIVKADVVAAATGPTAEALTDDTPVQETADGQADSQQAG